ncbi:ribonuclease H-like domain-containing protein, partial [Fennellomyces sp. T-0311]
MYRLIHLINKVRSMRIPISKQVAIRLVEPTASAPAYSRQLHEIRTVATVTAGSSSQQSSASSSQNETDSSQTAVEEDGTDDDGKSKAPKRMLPRSFQKSSAGQQAPYFSLEEEKNALEANLPILQWPGHYKVFCTADPDEMNAHITNLLSKGETVFGLDIEWPVSFQKGRPQGKVALIQICGQDTILLFQVSKLKKFPLELVRFLKNPLLFKSGVNIRGDGNKLYRDYALITDGLVELEGMTRHIDSPLLEKTRIRSLAVLTNLFLECKLPKEKKVRVSNWARNSLTEVQKKYAAL